MASSSSSLLVLTVLCFVSIISPSIAQQTCSSQNLRPSLQTCLDLPVLNSSLHYTYNASNSSLSVVFIATPSTTNGWVAWAINPNQTGMAGSQAFLAYRSDSGVASVKTYDIRSYSNLTEGKLTFDFWNLRVESMSGNRLAIHTTVKVPEGAEKVNQVWQIGGVWNSSTNFPGIHPAAPGSPNLRSMAELKLAGDGPTPAPTNGGGVSGSGGGSSSPPPGNAGSMTKNLNFGVNLGIFVLLGSFFIF